MSIEPEGGEKVKEITIEELKNRKIWFLWSGQPIKNGKISKIPFAADGGATGADEAHEHTWADYETAQMGKEKFLASGVGMKIQTGFFLLDIDHRNLEDPFMKEVF